MLSLSVFSSRTEFRKCAPSSVKHVSEGHSLFLRENSVLVNITVLTAVSLLHKSPATQTLCDVSFHLRTAVVVLSPVKHMY